MNQPGEVVAALADWLGLRHAEPVVIVPGAISDVLLVDDIAYKIKRPIRSYYVQYDSCDARHRFCLEEVRLNRRFWLELYQGVVPVTTTSGGVVLGGPGPAIDWAVQMTRFSQSDVLAAQPAGLSHQHAIQFGTDLGGIHSQSPVTSDVLAGTPSSTLEWIEECFDVIDGAGWDDRIHELSGHARALGKRTVQHLSPLLSARRARGFTREIHGDLHPGNLVLYRGRIKAFDCLEYSEVLRNLDVLVDVASASLGFEALLGESGSAAFVGAWASALPGAYHEGVAGLYRGARRIVDAKVTSLLKSGAEEAQRGRGSLDAVENHILAANAEWERCLAKEARE